MILVDANLLIYAVNSDLPQHPPAREWLETTLSGRQAVGLPWVSILAFLRITTRRDLFERALEPERALSYVDGWIAQPLVRAVAPGDKHWEILRNLVRASGLAGNLTSDAHLAAMAIENGATLFSADNDFKRFAGLIHLNPLT